MDTLVAMAILSISLTVLFRSISDNLVRVESSHSQWMASVIAQSLLAEAELDRPITRGSRSGRIEDRFNWSVAIEPYEAESPAEADMRSPADQGELFSIEVRIDWREGDRAREYVLSTLRFEATP
ncbi:MAG: hypothetical protein Tsb0010_04210 [Parvularculaceae bacterium]